MGANRLPIRFYARDLFIEISPGQQIEHILTIIATNHGLLVEDLYVVRDGEDEPADSAHPVHHGGYHRRHNVHHRHPVDVTVRYQVGTHHREFRRHAPLERVLDWAIRRHPPSGHPASTPKPSAWSISCGREPGPASMT